MRFSKTILGSINAISPSVGPEYLLKKIKENRGHPLKNFSPGIKSMGRFHPTAIQRALQPVAIIQTLRRTMSRPIFLDRKGIDFCSQA